MVKRTLCAVAATLSLVALIAQPALAASAATAARATAATSAAEAGATRASAARVAVGAILADYDSALFHMTRTSSACPNDGTRSNQGASCWWWAANAFMALISYAEKHPHSAYLGKIRTDLSDTYSNVCGGDCPAGLELDRNRPVHRQHPRQRLLRRHRLVGAGVAQRLQVDAQQEIPVSGRAALWGYVTAHGWRSGCSGGGDPGHQGQGHQRRVRQRSVPEELSLAVLDHRRNPLHDRQKRQGRRARGCQVRPGAPDLHLQRHARRLRSRVHDRRSSERLRRHGQQCMAAEPRRDDQRMDRHVRRGKDLLP